MCLNMCCSGGVLIHRMRTSHCVEVHCLVQAHFPGLSASPGGRDRRCPSVSRTTSTPAPRSSPRVAQCGCPSPAIAFDGATVTPDCSRYCLVARTADGEANQDRDRLMPTLTRHPLTRIRRREAVARSGVPQSTPAAGRGERRTVAASQCMNSGGDITKCVVPSRQGVFSLSTTCPAALQCTRSLASAERVMQRHSCSSAWRSPARQRTAACRLKPCMSAHSL